MKFSPLDCFPSPHLGLGTAVNSIFEANSAVVCKELWRLLRPENFNRQRTAFNLSWSFGSSTADDC